jgi:hypothetical protein
VCIICLMIASAAISTLATGEIGGQGSGGLWLLPNAERATLENEARQERLAIETTFKRMAADRRTEIENALKPWIVTANAVGQVVVMAFRVLALVVATWLAFSAVLYAQRRASTVMVWPNSAGLFPLLSFTVGNVQVVHDGNKAPTSVTIYKPDNGSVTVLPVSSDVSPAQLHAALAGAFVQAEVARHQHQQARLPVYTESRQDNQIEQASVPQWPGHVTLASLLDGKPDIARLVLGVTVNEHGQEIIVSDMARMVHVAVGGSSGWGKSKFLQVLAYQIAASGQAEMVMIDLEGVSFALFARCGALRYPIADNEHDALAILGDLVKELDRRKALFARHPGVESLAEYSQVAEPIKPIITLIDESTALLADRGIEGALKMLSLRARKYGLWLLMGGQDWKAASLDTAIRNQLSCRVQFKALSGAQSRVLLEQGGAEELDIPGRALMVLPGRDIVRAQTPFVSRAEIEAIITGGTPAYTMPQAADVATVDAQAGKIIELAEEGMSRAKIERKIFGFSGGAAYRKVKDVLG